MGESKKNTASRIVIIVLSVCLAICIAALCYVLLNGKKPVYTADVKDNVITSEKTAMKGMSVFRAAPVMDVTYSKGKDAEIELYKKHPEDNVAFCADNMFPGDIESRQFNVKVSYKGDVTVKYSASVRPGYEKLAEVLKCRISLNGKLMYDGLMKDMPKSIDVPLASASKTTDTLSYDITAYLETSVDNPYQNKTLIADFKWWVEEEENLEPVFTGDSTKVVLLCAAGALAVAGIVVLLVVRRKGDKNDK